MIAAMVERMPGTPAQIFLQAPSGCMAASAAAYARAHSGETPTIVEPEAVPAPAASMRTLGVAKASRAVPSTGRPDCEIRDRLRPRTEFRGLAIATDGPEAQ